MREGGADGILQQEYQNQIELGEGAALACEKAISQLGDNPFTSLLRDEVSFTIRGLKEKARLQRLPEDERRNELRKVQRLVSPDQDTLNLLQRITTLANQVYFGEVADALNYVQERENTYRGRLVSAKNRWKSVGSPDVQDVLEDLTGRKKYSLEQFDAVQSYKSCADALQRAVQARKYLRSQRR